MSLNKIFFTLKKKRKKKRKEKKKGKSDVWSYFALRRSMEKHFLRAQEDMGCSGTSSCFFTWNNLRIQNIVIIDHLSKKKKHCDY